MNPRIVIALVIAFPFVLEATWAQDDLVIRAGRVDGLEGAAIVDGEVLMRGGKIVAVGKRVETPEGTRRLVFPDAVIVPGFVDGGAHVGVAQYRDESTSNVNPSLRIADALDTADETIAKARRAGITTFHLMPGDAEVIGGRTAVVKVASDERVTWLRREAYLKCSLAPGAWRRGRAPTHVMGGVELLEQWKDDAALRPFWADRCFVAAFTSREVDVVSRLQKRCGLKPLLLANSSMLPHVGRVRATTRGVILDPLLPSLSDRWRRTPAALAKAGVKFGFASRAGARPAAGLRLSSVVARMAGLSADDALSAITLWPAQLLGVDDRVGSLARGKDADLVVLTHHPSDPRARVRCVVQGGRVVHHPKSVTLDSAK
ncbi:MAG: hypothetical protein CMJ83_19105 [Planctomycetes bacterium]|nr:hypothetical protein [Planctomycetota bacterium]